MTAALVILAIVAFLFLLYLHQAYWAWVGGLAIIFAAWAWGGIGLPWAFYPLLVLYLAVAILFGVPFLRRRAVTRGIMDFVGKVLPRLSETERIAMEAGTTWWDAELFSGRPRWRRLFGFKGQGLTQKEREFFEGPVEELCRMLDDWQIQREGDLPPEVWRFLKENGFMGLVVPEEYGGLGFSALAHSLIVTKVATRSITAAVTVMLPNSLGPGELLFHYGTEAQKKKYLPALATGEEVPCFALTEPGAGSDAGGSMEATGIVCKQTVDGQEVLGLRLTFRKRYITLAPIATLIGLAFRMYDPDHLLGDEEDLGITCAMIPRDSRGLDIGRRHDPMGVPFLNGPVEGTDIFAPIDVIIGGPERAGQGWRMLMQSLAAGRSISLPAMSLGAAQFCTRLIGSYASVREQFGLPIARFEGVAELIAGIAGRAYMMKAARDLTCGALDEGEKPAVIASIMKAYMTANMRDVVSHAMDIQGGAAICRGPRNSLARVYDAVPIAITVEGSNVLTRSMIVYGQGAIRCHPFVLDEVDAIATDDLKRFDRAFFSHVGAFVSHLVRAVFLGLTDGRVAHVPGAGAAPREAGRLARYSAGFALLSDIAMMTMGGTLKFREAITGRLADAFAHMYLASATLKAFAESTEADRDRPAFDWAMQFTLYRVERALDETLANLPSRTAARLARFLIFPAGRRRRMPDDAVIARLNDAVGDGKGLWQALTEGVYIPDADEDGLGVIEDALGKATAARAVQKKLRDAVREGTVTAARDLDAVEEARGKGVISDEEAATLTAAIEARRRAVEVDAFAAEELEGPADKPQTRHIPQAT